MKRIIILFLIFIIPNSLFSQETFRGRMGFGLGYFPTLGLLSIENRNLPPIFNSLPELSNEMVFYNKASGYLYILAVKDLRIGAEYLAGTSTRIANGEEIKSIRYSDSYGGITAEYTLSLGSFNLSLGSGFGYGKTFLVLSSYKENIKDLFENNVILSFNSVSLGSDYFIASPRLEIDHALNRFVALSISFGYNYRLRSSWKVDEIKVINSPEKLVRNEYFASAGLRIGFFTR